MVNWSQDFRGKGSSPCQHIDTTRKAIDCATTLPLTFLYNETLQQTFRPLLSKLSKRRQIQVLYPHCEEVKGGVEPWLNLMAPWKAPVEFLLSVTELLFTARRFASAVLATAIPSVCLSVRPSSVTHRYCVKTTARSTVQFAPLDSKMCLVLQKPKKIFPRDNPFPLKFWLQVTYPLLKAASFDTFCLVAPQL